MKKIICICLCICTLLGLVSCQKPTEEEILPELERLLAASSEINDICFGEGLSAKEGGLSIGSYQEAATEDMARFHIENVQDIREKMQEVYAKETCEWISSVIFKPVMVDSAVQSYARYYDYEQKDEDGRVTGKYLMVNGNYDPLTVGESSYSNVRIVKIKKDSVLFTMDITVTYEGETQVYRDGEYSLRMEDGAWRLSSPTYATFDVSKLTENNEK